MNSTRAPLIALISATPVAIPPVEQAFAELFPEAHLWNILDDRLLQSADAAGGLTPGLTERMRRLIRHAVLEGADGVLLTCSMYGGALQSAHVTVPAQAADEAAFDAVVNAGHTTVALLSSAKAPLDDSVARFAAHSESRGADVTVHGVEVSEAFIAARSGDVDALARALADGIGDAPEADAILLGQYSLAPAAMRLAELTDLPVFAGPQMAARSLRARLGGAAR
ncbi:hypothetical protein GCM10027416_18130 [Okibacterium endophyticum]